MPHLSPLPQPVAETNLTSCQHAHSSRLRSTFELSYQQVRGVSDGGQSWQGCPDICKPGLAAVHGSPTWVDHHCSGHCWCSALLCSSSEPCSVPSSETVWSTLCQCVSNSTARQTMMLLCNGQGMCWNASVFAPATMLRAMSVPTLVTFCWHNLAQHYQQGTALLHSRGLFWGSGLLAGVLHIRTCSSVIAALPSPSVTHLNCVTDCDRGRWMPLWRV